MSDPFNETTQRALAEIDPLTVRFFLAEIARLGLEDQYAAALLALKPESSYIMGDDWWLCSAPPAAHAQAFIAAHSRTHPPHADRG